MSEDKRVPKISEEATRAYQTAYLRIAGPAAAKRFWERNLRPNERQQLGSTFKQALLEHKNVFGFLLALNSQISGEQAVLDAARELGFLSIQDHAWLLREILGNSPPVVHCIRPDWDRELGRLTFNGEIIRKVQVRTRSNIVKILDSFQEESWPKRIDDPLKSSDNGQRRRDAISTLNRNLEQIKFRADGQGTGIVWELKQ